MFDNIKSLFDFTKLPTKFYFLIAVVSGFLLFANEGTVQLLKLEQFIETYGEFFGVTFLFSAGLVVVNFTIWLMVTLSRSVKKKQASIKLRKSIDKTLLNLDEKEKSVLREFYIKNQKTIEMPITDPVIAGLVNQGILKYASQNGRIRISKCNRVQDRFFPLRINQSIESKLDSSLIDLTEENREHYKRPLWSTIQYRF